MIDGGWAVPAARAELEKALAVTETVAHLRLLTASGVLESGGDEDEVVIYRLAAPLPRT